MPEPAQLNHLLHWAVENTPAQPPPPPQPADSITTPSLAPHPSDPPLSLTFNPTPGSTLSDALSQSQQPPKKKLDTGVLDAILGRTDAIRMREAIEVLDDRSKTLDQRCLAAEALEELVQDLDNANDLEVLGIWPRLINLLRSPTEPEPIKFQVCWICGTAVQNNPRSQTSFFKHDPIAILLDILNNASEEYTQAKALYCLSSALKHAPEDSKALEAFTSNSGWESLKACLKGPSMNLRRKAVYLINSIAMQSHGTLLSSLRPHRLLESLLCSVSPSRGIPAGRNGEQLPQDDDFTEKALRAITTIVLQSKVGDMSEEEKGAVRELLDEIDERFIRVHRLHGAGVAESEWHEFLSRVGVAQRL